MNSKILILFVLLASKISIYSAPVHTFLEGVIPENPIIVEAGAQWGQDTKIFCNTWPNGTIYAFEPLPKYYASLEKLKIKFSNLKTFPKALSDQSGENIFYIAGAASSLLK